MKSSMSSALIYGLIFAATGVSLPYAGLWFESRGLSGSEIAVILAVPMLARAVTGPMVAIWADGFRLRRTALAWLSLVAALAYGACIYVEGFGLWLVLWFVASTAASSLIPLSDAFTLKLARREGFAKIYDLAERVYPPCDDPGSEATIDWACHQALDRLTFATSGELAAFWGKVTPDEAKAWCAAATCCQANSRCSPRPRPSPACPARTSRSPRRACSQPAPAGGSSTR